MKTTNLEVEDEPLARTRLEDVAEIAVRAELEHDEPRALRDADTENLHQVRMQAQVKHGLGFAEEVAAVVGARALAQHLHRALVAAGTHRKVHLAVGWEGVGPICMLDTLPEQENSQNTRAAG